MIREFAIAFVIWNVLLPRLASADVIADVLDLPESERPAYVALKLEEYASQFSSSVISFTATDRGTMDQVIQEDSLASPGPTEIKKVKGKMVHELTLSANDRYANIQDIDGHATLITYNGKDGKRYGFDKNKKMTYVDHYCDFPDLQSMSLDLFVNLTGITTFKSSSNADLINKVKGYLWRERRFDPKLGDCIVLYTESRGDRLEVERNAMYFGVRDSFLVLLRDESMLQYENDLPVNGVPALIRYKWLKDFEYGQKFGKLLPESWNFVITDEYCDMDGRLLPLSNELHKNPNIIRSMITTISKVKFLKQFPTELFNVPVGPQVPLVDSCQKAVQVAVAKEQKTGRWFSNWLLGLGMASCILAVYFYVRNRRK